MSGDVGTAVLVHGADVAFEVEFVGYDGTPSRCSRSSAARCDRSTRATFYTPGLLPLASDLRERIESDGAVLPWSVLERVSRLGRWIGCSGLHESAS